MNLLNEWQSLNGYLIDLTAHLQPDSLTADSLMALCEKINTIALADGVYIQVNQVGHAHHALNHSDVTHLEQLTCLLKDKEPFFIQDFKKERLAERLFLYRGKLGSLMVIPMHGKSFIGTLYINRKEIEAFLPSDMEIALQIANAIVYHMEYHQAYKSLMLDAETGFLKKDAFLTQLRLEVVRSRRHQSPLSVLLLEAHIDPAAVSKALFSLKHTHDLLGKLSTTLYAIALPHMKEKSILLFAERIKNQLGSSYKIPMAIAYLRLDEDDAYSLLLRADRALTSSKRQSNTPIVIGEG